MNGIQLPVLSLGFRVLLAVLCIGMLFGCLQPLSQDTGNGEPATPPPDAGNGAPVAPNVTEPVPNVTENVTEPAPPDETVNQTPETGNGQPETAFPETTDLTVGQLLDKELDTLPSPSGGPYSIVTYRWVSNGMDKDGMIIAFEPALQIKFDYKTQSNLVGFAFKTYEPTEGGGGTANGVAVFINKSSYLEQLQPLQRVDIDFNVPGLERKLYDSRITSKKMLIDLKGRLLVIYRFESPYID